MSDSRDSDTSSLSLDSFLSPRVRIMFRKERTFIALIGFFFILAGITFPYAGIAKWIGFALYIFFGLGILFYMRGARIQKVVTEKSDVRDIRSASIH